MNSLTRAVVLNLGDIPVGDRAAEGGDRAVTQNICFFVPDL